MRVTEAYVALIPLTLPLSREGRGKRMIVKGINAFVLVQDQKITRPFCKEGEYEF